MLAVVLAAAAFAQETVIKVPQGSGVFPTVGQVNCLEEMGSGRLCAATYECSGESGRLWGDLANHDGRRAINQDSPVARGRDCTITIDGRAAVRWMTGYSPDGRDGRPVGLTTSAEALRPVVRGGSTSTVTGEDGGSLLAYILERHNTTLADIADLVCQGQDDRNRTGCEDGLLRTIFGHHGPGILYGGPSALSYGDVAGFADLQENAVTRCLVELYETPGFCDGHTGFRFTRNAAGNVVHWDGVDREAQLSCNEDGTVTAYHLIKWPDLYWTFSALRGGADGGRITDPYYWSEAVYALTGSEQGRQCAALAVDKLQSQYGVELIEYDAAGGNGWITIGD